MSFSLYVHIPYCQSKCPYCDFNSYAATAWPEERYTEAIVSEMRCRARQPPWLGQAVKTIFFGGGTPSLFAAASIGRIIEEADRLFGLEDGAEITLEANPGTVDALKLSEIRKCGVNRISFGAQSFNDSILKFLGRIHSAEQTRVAVEMAHHAGFDRLNLDLIFAVPGQTVDDVTNDVAEAAALGPDHISAYNLTFEEGTAFFTDLKRGRIRALENDEQARMYALVREQLPERGYPMYEISNYARPGHEARHNLSYWRADSYLGLGAGAHSFARDGRGGRRWWNKRIPARYVDKVIESGVGEAGGETIDARIAPGEFVFLNLRLRDGFALAEFEHRFGDTFDNVYRARATVLIENGLLVRSRERIYLSDRGLELADSVFAEFI